MAALQQVIKYVHQEMKAYHLYTVVPKLLAFIDQLTNWYVRLNRLRLKGTGTTHEDSRAGLSTLYTVLHALARLMGPFTPFFAEWLYQALESDEVKTGESTASVHYCMVPDYDASMLDEKIEVTMGHLQTAISLGRLVREQRNISFKSPSRKSRSSTRTRLSSRMLKRSRRTSPRNSTCARSHFLRTRSSGAI